MSQPSPGSQKVFQSIWATLRRGFSAWLFVAKLTVPALVLTRLLLYFDLIPHVAAVFRPVMLLVGLPPESALIWVTAMLGNLYVTVIVFANLLPVMGLPTLAQASILGGMCLMAHGLLAEGQVCRATGLSFWRVSVFRIVSAILFGALLNFFFTLTGWGPEPSSPVSLLQYGGDPVPPWMVWAWGVVRQLLMILALVETLMLFMELVKYLQLTRLISKMLGPPLRLAGVGENALMVTIIGCVVGLTLGGGLIVAESRSGRLTPGDIYGAMMLMAVFHSLFEDTLLLWLLGGSLWWLVGARLILALFLASAVTRLARRPAWKPILVGPKLEL